MKLLYQHTAKKKTMKELLNKFVNLRIHQVEKENSLINSTSKDNTVQSIKEYSSKIKLNEHKKNKIKGAVMRAGLEIIMCYVLIAQDSGLKYDLNQIPILLSSSITNQGS